MRQLCWSAVVLIIATKSSGELNGLRRRRTDDRDLFGDADDEDEFFGDSFKEMKQSDRVHDKLEEGFDIWEDRCLKVGGQQVLDRWLDAQEQLIYCIMQHFDVANIQTEMNAKKATGDLDLVFKKYCGSAVVQTRPCIEQFLLVSSLCLKPEDHGSLESLMIMIDAAIDFACHNSGDRIALFMAEKGMECLTERQEFIIDCFNKSVPELFSTTNTRTSSRRRSIVIDPVLVFDRRNCQHGFDLRQCMENELLRCDDPTPSNIINAMLLAMWNTTPCRQLGRHRPYTSSLSGSPSSLFTTKTLFSLLLLPSLLKLLA